MFSQYSVLNIHNQQLQPAKFPKLSDTEPMLLKIHSLYFQHLKEA
jgi:hypothetical protein